MTLGEFRTATQSVDDSVEVMVLIDRLDGKVVLTEIESAEPSTVFRGRDVPIVVLSLN